MTPELYKLLEALVVNARLPGKGRDKVAKAWADLVGTLPDPSA